MEKQFDLLCTGMALVDSIIRGFDPEPISASGFRAESGSLNVGGEAVNEAMAAAKLGLHTAILCALGEDGAGDMVLDAMRRSGVDTSTVARSKEHPTPVTTMFVNEDGSRKSITNGSHRYNMHPENYPQLIASARAITLGSMFRAPYDAPEVIEAVIRTAKDAGTIILADTKLPNFRRLTLAELQHILPLVDYIFPNEDEAKYYSGKSDPDEMAEVFLSYGVRNVIIKLGAQGCLFRNARERIVLPACRIRPVDATGAGDNFLAGFAAALLQEKEPQHIADHREILRFANACGAICTAAVGANTGLKSKAQVEAFLQDQN